jgi:hypothetical protein
MIRYSLSLGNNKISGLCLGLCLVLIGNSWQLWVKIDSVQAMLWSHLFMRYFPFFRTGKVGTFKFMITDI